MKKLLLLSALFSLLLFACNENGPNPAEKAEQAKMNSLFDSGNTVNVQRLVNGNFQYTLFKDNGDTVILTVSEEIKIFTYTVTVVDTVVKPKKVTTSPVTNTPSTGTRQNIVFEASFDGSKPFMTENELYKQACCSYSVTQSKSIVRSGDGSFRAEVRGTDKSTSSGYRAEFITAFGKQTEAWYGYSTYFENWNSFSGGEHVIQWHPPSDDGSADLSLQTAANKFDVVRSINGTNYRQSGTLKPIVSNRWYDFVWHVKWSTGNDGLIELWIDGEKYYSFTGRTASIGTPYFKFGINRWNMENSNRILYYDNLRIGNEKATYNDVAPVQKAF